MSPFKCVPTDFERSMKNFRSSKIGTGNHERFIVHIKERSTRALSEGKGTREHLILYIRFAFVDTDFFFFFQRSATTNRCLINFEGFGIIIY